MKSKYLSLTTILLAPLFAFTPLFSSPPVHDLAAEFANPPKGYGEVPFYWWNGDSLNRARLLWQLQKLHQAGVQGFSVSYHHTHPQADTQLNRNGYGAYGRTEAGQPEAFTRPWWDIWTWFSRECGKLGMGVGLDDYTFGWPGNGFWPDEIAHLPDVNDYPGFLYISTPVMVKAGGQCELFFSESAPFAIFAYPVSGSVWQVDKAISLLPLAQNGKLVWIAPATSDWMVASFTTGPGLELHPRHGEYIIKHYFNQFADRLDSLGIKGMNYFFQDELEFNLGIGRKTTWAADMAAEFRKRKGYELLAYLPALATDIGPITPKVRLDYYDVMIDLAEERYFKPVFQWHADRGLIYGCDNNGRGLDPLSYGDYFRATRWFTAPGNDAPGRGLAFIQTKVSSSVAHLYQRPRVWLEAFHSMGWDARPEWLTEQLDRHFLLGGNLLCLHGLDYSLHGGWFEWAPPCFHLNMPYWPHMQYWLKYAERLSYLLSQGTHDCDVAILYPVAPLQAGTSTSPDIAFQVARKLYDAGIDFDFIDDASLQKADISKGMLSISNEHYRVLVLADMSSIRFKTLEKTFEFSKSGGLVLSAGNLPLASDRIGRNDLQLDNLVRAMFGPVNHNPGQSKSMDVGNDLDRLVRFLGENLTLDCKGMNGSIHYLHRHAADKEIYMVMDANPNELIFFQSRGKPEVWDAWTGTTRPIPVTETTANGTWLRLPMEPPRSSIIVFSPGSPLLEKKQIAVDEKKQSLTGMWQCELAPTRDNRWGDFRQPATTEWIGAEAPEFRYAPLPSAGKNWWQPGYSDSAWSQVRASSGPQLWQLRVSRTANFDSLCSCVVKQPQRNTFAARHTWEPYEFSWRWGVENQPGSQGYHGLKGKVSNDFIIMPQDGHYFYRAFFNLSESATVTINTSGVEPQRIWIDAKPVRDKKISLNAGHHQLMFAYKNISTVPFELGPHLVDNRSRSALVLSLADSNKISSYPLAMKWYKMADRIPYDVLDGQAHADCFRFVAPPGLQEMHFKAYGEPTAWINGASIPVQVKREPHGLRDVSIRLDAPVAHATLVALQIKNEPGFYAGAAIPEPIRLTCGKGEIPTGDWSTMGMLKHYSGGMWYRRTLHITDKQKWDRTSLDLGQVVATCEVWINDHKAGVLVNRPFTLDIGSFLQEGDNTLAVLVYNTLSNHYQTIPSYYKGRPLSGLMGPVQLIFQHIAK